MTAYKRCIFVLVISHDNDHLTNEQLPDGLVAQSVKQCSGVYERVWNPLTFAREFPSLIFKFNTLARLDFFQAFFQRLWSAFPSRRLLFVCHLFEQVEGLAAIQLMWICYTLPPIHSQRTLTTLGTPSPALHEWCLGSLTSHRELMNLYA